LLEDDTGLAGEASRRRLASVLTQCERMDHLLADLLDYARPPAPEPVARPVAEALEDLRELSPRVTVGSGPTDIVWSDPEHLRHILTNLVTNALECSPAETPVEVSSQTLDGEVEIRVADCGPGPGDDPEHLFEPYVTTRASGTGLGLPLARALARANGGSLRLEARLGGGAQAVVRLPRPPHGGKGAP
jgi:two-component system sensor histidine kinase PilS (NtrC family)